MKPVRCRGWLALLLPLAFTQACQDDMPPAYADGSEGIETPEGSETLDGDVGSGTDEGQNSETNGTLFDLASERPELSTFVHLIESADLETILQQDERRTVFAPTNDAIKNTFGLFQVTIEDIENNPQLLKALLEYHVLQGEIRTSDITEATAKVGIGAEYSLIFSPLGPSFVINAESLATANSPDRGAIPVTPDIEADNGVLHVIDRVLIPPDIPRLAAYITYTELAPLEGAVAAIRQSPDVYRQLNYDILANNLPAAEEVEWTLFAPTGAWRPADTTELQYHVLPSGNTIEDLESGPSPTSARPEFDSALPLTLFIEKSGASVQLNPIAQSPRGSTVGTHTDLRAVNGYIHVIDQPLQPLNVGALLQVAGFDRFYTMSLEAEPFPDTSSHSLAGETLEETWSRTDVSYTTLALSNAAVDEASLDELDASDLMLALSTYILPDTTLSVEGLRTTGSVLAVLNELLFAGTPLIVTGLGSSTATFDPVLRDLVATNGVVHSIDHVLVAPPLPGDPGPVYFPVPDPNPNPNEGETR